MVTSGSRDASTVSCLPSAGLPPVFGPAFWSTDPPVRSLSDVINVSGHRLSTAEIESALIVHAGVSETAVIGTADELTGQAVYAFVSMKPEFDFSAHSEPELLKELTLQVRKVIGPFAGELISMMEFAKACVDLRTSTPHLSSQGHLPGG